MQNMVFHSAMNVILSLLLLHFNVNIASTISKGSSHHTSCLTLKDGLHYIRPLAHDNNFPSILVQCSSGWTILDYSLDPNIQYYFTSFSPITNEFSSMDISLEHRNWNHWLQIKSQDYTTSDDCNSCDINNLNKAYHMTGNYFGCSFATKLLCDMDTNTNQCFQCTLPNDHSSNVKLYAGVCTHSVLSLTNTDINNEWSSHKKCETYEWNYLPSIGTNGKYCMCLKPKSSREDWVVDALYFKSLNNQPEPVPDKYSKIHNPCEIIY
eukprot:265107_1